MLLVSSQNSVIDTTPPQHSHNLQHSHLHQYTAPLSPHENFTQHHKPRTPQHSHRCIAPQCPHNFTQHHSPAWQRRTHTDNTATRAPHVPGRALLASRPADTTTSIVTNALHLSAPQLNAEPRTHTHTHSTTTRSTACPGCVMCLIHMCLVGG